MTTSVSFDISFAKAMRLLQSEEPDATEQLKAMLDECLAQKKAPQTTISTKQQSTSIKPVVPMNKIQQPAHVPVSVPIIVPSDDIDSTSLSCVVCK